jgi:prepilin-type N-terminal cleavage/methylation domain-containing protein
MQMRRIVRYRSRASEEGFTLLEVLVGMAILSLLGVGVWTAVTASFRSAERLQASALANAQILQIDDRLRDCTVRVRAPWWAEPPSIQAAEHTWRIAYLDGKPEKKLVVSWNDRVLSIDDGACVSRYPGYSSASLSAAVGADGRVFGLTLTIEGKYVGHISIVARYGGAEVRSGSAS